jgi:IS66 C-terminal element
VGEKRRSHLYCEIDFASLEKKHTIIESCRCRGMDPYAYLCDVFTTLPPMTNFQVKHVTPEAWAKTHSATCDARIESLVSAGSPRET